MLMKDVMEMQQDAEDASIKTGKLLKWVEEDSDDGDDEDQTGADKPSKKKSADQKSQSSSKFDSVLK